MKEITDDLKKLNNLEAYIDENITIYIDYKEFDESTEKLFQRYAIADKTYIKYETLNLIEQDLENKIVLTLVENTKFIEELKILMKQKENIICSFLKKDEAIKEQSKEESYNTKETKRVNQYEPIIYNSDKRLYRKQNLHKRYKRKIKMKILTKVIET